MFSVPQYSSELQQYGYFVMQEPVFEEKIEEPVFTHVYEENGLLYCASQTSEGVYWYTYALNNPLIYTDPTGYMYDPTEHEPKGPLLLEGQKPIIWNSWAGYGGGQFAGCGFDYESLASAYNNSMSYRPPEAGYRYEDPNGWMQWKAENISRNDIEFTAVPVFTSGKGLDTRLVQIMYFEGDNYFDSDYFNTASNDGEAYSIENAVNWLNENAHNRWQDAEGKCGTYVRRGIEAGFGLEADALKGKTTNQTGYAKYMGPYLQRLGFQPFQTTTYLIGDIAVIQNYEGGNPAGHVQMYNGSIWISDFKQMNGFWPGPGYRRNQPEFIIYRWNF